MAKDWVIISTINDVPKNEKSFSEKFSQNRKNSNMIRNIKSLDIEDLKKNGDLHYEEKVAKEDNLVSAYIDKRLKSKNLIKTARDLKIARDKAARKAEKKEQKNSSESVATA